MPWQGGSGRHIPMKFSEKVYQLCKKIPKGSISTYKILAEKLNTRAYRAVGNALNKNKSSEIPCHRVVDSNGYLHGFATGLKNKARLLRKEGIKIKNNKIINFENILYKF